MILIINARAYTSIETGTETYPDMMRPLRMSHTPDVPQPTDGRRSPLSALRRQVYDLRTEGGGPARETAASKPSIAMTEYASAKRPCPDKPCQLWTTGAASCG